MPDYGICDNLANLRSRLADDARQRLSLWLKLECTRPSWIFSDDLSGRFARAFILLTHPGYGIPIESAWLPEPVAGESIDLRLLRQGIDCARKSGAKELFCSSSEDFQRHTQLGDLGFRPWREAILYRTSEEVKNVTSDYRIIETRFFSRTEIICLIEEASLYSDDSQVKHFQKSYGYSVDARNTLEVLELAPRQSSWWFVAVDQADRKVGLILPVLNYGELTIGFIGVLPALRGRGIARFLLHEFLTIAKRSAYSAVHAEVDVRNKAMQRLALKSGFRLVGRKFEWRLMI